jgi:hypothetical protein
MSNKSYTFVNINLKIMKTKISFIDENISSQDLETKTTYVYSKSGIGKTSLLVKITANISLQDNTKILFVNDSENIKAIQRKFLSSLSNIPLNELDKNVELLEKKFSGENTSVRIKKIKDNTNLNEFLNKNLDYDLIVLDVQDIDEFDIVEFKNKFSGTLFISQYSNGKHDISLNENNYIFIDKTIHDKENDTANITIITNKNIVNNLKVNFNNNTLNIK